MSEPNRPPAAMSNTGLVGEHGAPGLPATPPPPAAPGAEPPEVATEAEGFDAYLRRWVKQVRGGESGVLPIAIGLVILGAIFQSQNSVFLSAANLTNLIILASYFILFAMAEVFVLLLGEIDLSIGYVAFVGATVMCWLATSPVNLPWWVAILACLGTTSAIGLIQGLLITRLGVPSFVVTLAGLLGWQGLLIWLIGNVPSGNGGTIAITNNVLNDITYGNLTVAAGWIVTVAIVAAFGLFMLRRDRARRRAGLTAPPVSVTLLKIGLTAVAAVIVLVVVNADRGRTAVLEGMPWVVLIVLAIVSVYSLLLGRTRYGRYVYAIGGNAEAARRAGVNLRRIRTGAFMLTGLTAGFAGIVYASQLGSINESADGANLVLYGVAGAVIGGTSLVGGRGKMAYALLGGFVVATIQNGMALIGLSSAAQLMVTALVLLAAVTVDAVSRRNRSVTVR